MNTPHDFEQVGHIARLAVLAMCARGVAAAEFQSSPEVQTVRITVHRDRGTELPVDCEFIGTHAMPIGGLSL